MEKDTLRTFRYSVSEIPEALGKCLSLVSQAMCQLQDAGLVAEERVEKTRYYERDLDEEVTEDV